MNRKKREQLTEKSRAMKVMNCMKNLGIYVSDSRNYFQNHGKRKLVLDQKMSNMT